MTVSEHNELFPNQHSTQNEAAQLRASRRRRKLDPLDIEASATGVYLMEVIKETTQSTVASRHLELVRAKRHGSKPAKLPLGCCKIADRG